TGGSAESVRRTRRRSTAAVERRHALVQGKGARLQAGGDGGGDGCRDRRQREAADDGSAVRGKDSRGGEAGSGRDVPDRVKRPGNCARPRCFQSTCRIFFRASTLGSTNRRPSTS